MAKLDSEQISAPIVRIEPERRPSCLMRSASSSLLASKAFSASSFGTLALRGAAAGEPAPRSKRRGAGPEASAAMKDLREICHHAAAANCSRGWRRCEAEAIRLPARAPGTSADATEADRQGQRDRDPDHRSIGGPSPK